MIQFKREGADKAGRIFETESQRESILQNVSSITAGQDSIIISSPSNKVVINVAEIDKAGSVPAITGSTPSEIALEIARNFFFDVAGGGGGGGFNLQQYALDTGYTPEFQSIDQANGYNSKILQDGSVRAVPILIEQSISFDELRVKVTNSGAATGKFALYDSGDISIGDLGVPVNKLYDFGIVDCSTTGDKVLSVPGSELEAGVYWFVYGRQSGSGARIAALNDTKPIYPSGFSASGNGYICYVEQSFPTANALPNQFTTPWTNKVTTNASQGILFFKKSV